MPQEHVQNTGPNIKFVDGKMLISGEGLKVEVGPVVNPPTLRPVDLDVNTNELVTPEGQRTALNGDAGGGSSGGGAGDSITATTRTGNRLDSFTIGGVKWTYTYVGSTPVALSAFGGLLNIDLTENAYGDYVCDPADNVIVNGGAVRCTKAQVAAITASMTSNMHLRLRVIDGVTSVDDAGTVSTLWLDIHWVVDQWEVIGSARWDNHEEASYTGAGRNDNIRVVQAPAFVGQKRGIWHIDLEVTTDDNNVVHTLVMEVTAETQTSPSAVILRPQMSMSGGERIGAALRLRLRNTGQNKQRAIGHSSSASGVSPMQGGFGLLVSSGADQFVDYTITTNGNSNSDSITFRLHLVSNTNTGAAVRVKYFGVAWERG